MLKINQASTFLYVPFPSPSYSLLFAFVFLSLPFVIRRGCLVLFRIRLPRRRPWAYQPVVSNPFRAHSRDHHTKVMIPTCVRDLHV